MTNTTLCYIQKDQKWLLLHRVKKDQDANRGKWIGVGGKMEEGESPEDCLMREVKEETGLDLLSYRARGIITFVSDVYGTEYMHLFTATEFSGELQECSEGVLAWIPAEQLTSLPMWEGDRIFLSLLHTEMPFFSLKLTYRGDALVSAFLDGKPLAL